MTDPDVIDELVNMGLLRSELREHQSTGATVRCEVLIDDGKTLITNPTDFYTNIGVNASLPGLTRLWSDHRLTRTRLEARGTPGPSLDVATRIDDVLTLCREIRTTWPADRVRDWQRLVNGGMSPERAKQAVELIHAEADLGQTDAPTPTQVRWVVWGRGLTRKIGQSVQLLRSRDCWWGRDGG